MSKIKNNKRDIFIYKRQSLKLKKRHSENQNDA